MNPYPTVEAQTSEVFVLLPDEDKPPKKHPIPDASPEDSNELLLLKAAQFAGPRIEKKRGRKILVVVVETTIKGHITESSLGAGIKLG